MPCQCQQRRQAMVRGAAAVRAGDGDQLKREIQFIATTSAEDIARSWRGMFKRFGWPGSKSKSAPPGSSS